MWECHRDLICYPIVCYRFFFFCSQVAWQTRRALEGLGQGIFAHQVRFMWDSCDIHVDSCEIHVVFM